ncbi:DNA-binding domain-containing protein [Marinicella litoralis]|uniref:Uncharacterized protein n=1 Tax=Marinicella litoralis TaxID=644220 RepID=A0A4R6XG87_9GAMM|nr:putative DNA-binding domain-containing protein [Marinicella litoralis]TDR16820.1 hypothetical protein C8D91_2727 [Marinicella litoralis]
MPNKPTFKQAQVDFAAHIRNPEANKIPDQIEHRRMAIYLELFINSIAGLLAGSFPVIRSLYKETAWKNLVRDFYRMENNKTPHFPEIPREFVEYLKHRQADPNKPFLYELAHYEWIELHLEKHNIEINKNPAIDTNDLLMAIPEVSPLVKVQAYQFPVHQIKASNQPKQPLDQPLFMLIWRDTEYQVHFSELNPFSALLLETLINNKKATGQQVLETLGEQHQHPDLAQFVQFGLQTLNQWHQQDIILTVKNK